MERDRDAALHVRDAGAEAALLVAPERPGGGGSERIDRVVVAEQRDLRPARAAQPRVQVQATGSGHELRLQPVALAGPGEQARQAVQRVEVAARRVDVDPRREVAEQELDLPGNQVADAGGFLGGVIARDSL